MQINIKAKNLELTSSINDYINKRIKSIEKLVKDDSGALFEIEVGRTTFHHKKGDIFRAEINLKFKGESLYASSEKEELYTAIDEVRNEVKSKLLTYKKKRETVLKRGGRQIKDLLKNIRFRSRG